MCYSAEVELLCLKAGREKEHQRTTITSLSFFGRALKANHLCNLTAKKTAGSPKPAFSFFFYVLKSSPRRVRGITFI